MSNLLLRSFFPGITGAWFIDDFEYSFSCLFGLFFTRNLRHGHSCPHERQKDDINRLEYILEGEVWVTFGKSGSYQKHQANVYKSDAQ
jgi:hypothetical protein